MQRTRDIKQIEEERTRTLYVRLPHTIKNEEEVKALLAGDVKIKLPRQSSRHCHVVFSDVAEKMKNLKALKKKEINGKRVIACLPKSKPLEEKEIKKQIKKKVTIPKPNIEPQITQVLFVTNIKAGTKALELKEAIAGCTSVAMMKANEKNLRSAIVKLNNLEIAEEYLKKKRKWPVVRGNMLYLKPDTRKRGRRHSKKPQLKIWDGETEITGTFGSLDSSKRNDKKSQECDNANSDSSVIESEENEEE